MKKTALAIFLTLTILISTFCVIAKDDAPFLYQYPILIERVIDGDTIVCTVNLGFDISLVNQKVRILGIDAFETKGRNKDKGLKAKELAVSWLSEGQFILVTTGKRDVFGRVLGNIKNAQGEFLKNQLKKAKLVTSRFEK